VHREALHAGVAGQPTQQLYREHDLGTQG
jgi:hypothetical protein